MLFTRTSDLVQKLQVAPRELALENRLVHHATIFEMNVESYRRRAALHRQTRAGRPPTYATIKTTEQMSRSDNQEYDQPCQRQSKQAHNPRRDY